MKITVMYVHGINMTQSVMLLGSYLVKTKTWHIAYNDSLCLLARWTLAHI